MALTAGTRLGVYEITAQIGEGGMGQVYRATDTKLKRQVAIKILPPAVAADADRLARFQREAEVLASLNHPHIAAIYGLEESGGMTALVMELVEGDDLSQLIAKGRSNTAPREGAPYESSDVGRAFTARQGLPIDEALPIAKQIAEALEAAHEQGIIHRDLKPANIKVRADGTVKVLDFGLAKAMEPAAGSSPSVSQAPTITTPAMMTGVGMILGTAAYMAPEQARGKTVDKRADIWAFGAVLFEMLTGTRAFPGDDLSETLAAVIKSEPDWTRLPADVPARPRQVIRGCLQKNAKQRIDSIQDVRLALDGAFETAVPQTTRTATQAAAAATSKWPRALAGAATVIAAAALWVAWGATRPAEQALRPLVRLDVDLVPDVSPGSPRGTDAILSPDGTRLVYVSQGRLFTRRLDQSTATELPDTQGAFAPFFSPDGQWVAFFTTGKLQKISMGGGSAITVCDASNGAGGSWGEDGDIIAALNSTGALSRIPSGGGPPTRATDLQNGEVTHRWPQILPGGKAVLFTDHTGSNEFDRANVAVMTLADRSTKTLVQGGTFARYVPSGHLVYVNRGTLFAVGFDVDRLEVHGTPAPVLDRVGYNATVGSAQLDFSQDGTLIYRSGGVTGGGLFTVAWLDGTGKVQPLLARPGNYGRPSMSPDGQRLALDVTAGSGTDSWVYDWQRDTMTRLTFTGNASYPVWSPDGRYIAFRTVGDGMSVTRSDGSGQPQPLTQSKNLQIPHSFTPDGKRVAFFESNSETSFDMWTVPLESDTAGLRAGKPEVFLQTPASELDPSVSPDGRWMALTLIH